MLSAITRPRGDQHELNYHRCHYPQDGYEASQPPGCGREYEIFKLGALREQLGGNERTRGVPIEGVLYVQVTASTILFVSDDDLVCASAEGDSLASRVHAHLGGVAAGRAARQPGPPQRSSAPAYKSNVCA